MASCKGEQDDAVVTYSQFACIGAGFSAIGLGATLKRWYGINDIRFFERHEDLGGTWHINKYPGCACDVPSSLYSFSFAPNPDWTRVLPSREELWAYLRSVAESYELPRRMTFRTVVESARWIEDRHCWRLTMRHLPSQAILHHESQFLFAATGQLVRPRELEIPGLSTRFRGRTVHSARWPSSSSGLDLDFIKGKRVVVFGNGCTAAQIVPAIARDCAQLTQIVRSKHWIFPPVDSRIPGWVRFLLRTLPALALLSRLAIFLLTEYELLRGDFQLTASAARFRKERGKTAERYMRATAPEKYHDLLIPDFEVGCKRRIFDSGYLRSLHEDNVGLTDAKPVEVVEEGVRMADGTFIEADVIVAATGFVTNHFLDEVEVSGRRGVTPQQHWSGEEKEKEKEKGGLGGIGAYNCSAMSGFPNFFMLLGPNSATGHTSAVMASENSINYALRVIEPVLAGRRGWRAVEVKMEAERAYVERMQHALRSMVWNSGCGSWYTRDAAGTGGSGQDKKKTWNAMSYPWSQAHYWYRSLFPTWADWNFTGPVMEPRPSSAWSQIMATLSSRLGIFAHHIVYGPFPSTDWKTMTTGWSFIDSTASLPHLGNILRILQARLDPKHKWVRMEFKSFDQQTRPGHDNTVSHAQSPRTSYPGPAAPSFPRTPNAVPPLRPFGLDRDWQNVT